MPPFPLCDSVMHPVKYGALDVGSTVTAGLLAVRSGPRENLFGGTSLLFSHLARIVAPSAARPGLADKLGGRMWPGRFQSLSNMFC